MIIVILNVLLALALFGVVAVLLTGVVGLAIGGEFNRKYANKLMRARVATQAAAVVILLLRILAHDLLGS
ncbi:MAG: HIG1 domain-containing protein [Rhodospirillaceae bacterium]|nr:HIG1 domain-containing protein [Rhodospirillaceae bacterium]